MALMNFDRGAIAGNAIAISSTAPQAQVVDAVVVAAMRKPGMLSKKWQGSKTLDQGEWAEHVGSDLGIPRDRVLAVISHRPGLAHEIAVLDFEGTAGLVFFVDGLPDMKMVSFGRGQAKGVAKAAAADLTAAGFPSNLA